jgi:hypothetical protein
MIDDMDGVSLCVDVRDDNLGMGIQTDGCGYRDNFLLVCDTHTRLKLRWVRDGYFFPIRG